MVGIDLPGEERLSAGPARNLVVSLHELYWGAGRPGLRRIAKAIMAGDFTDTISHEAVSDMLNGKSVPRWSKLECVVRQLAAWNLPRLDPEETAARFLLLWQAATGAAPQPGPSALPDAAAASRSGIRDQEMPTSPPRPRADAIDGGALTARALRGNGQALAEKAPAAQAPHQGLADDEWSQAREAVLACRPRWQGPDDDGQTAELRHLQDNQISHPAINARSSRPDRPPAVRIGVRMACSPLPAMQPTSSTVRSNFLSFLSRQPQAELVADLTDPGRDAKWEKWGGHGRSNHEAVLITGDEKAAPAAWARLLLPEPRMPIGWRDSGYALFLLHIERQPWEVDGPLAPPIPFLDWHAHFRKVLDCPSALAGFLTQDLGLDIPASDPARVPGTEDFYTLPRQPLASVALWLTTPHAMTDLVDISGYQQLPGSPASPQFGAYAVTHANGSRAPEIAIDWMNQMCDYTLHLDDYDSSLLTLRHGPDAE